MGDIPLEDVDAERLPGIDALQRSGGTPVNNSDSGETGTTTEAEEIKREQQNLLFAMAGHRYQAICIPRWTHHRGGHHLLHPGSQCRLLAVEIQLNLHLCTVEGVVRRRNGEAVV